MPQLALFEISIPSHSYDVAITPEVERALADHAPVAIGVSGGKDSSAVAIRTFEYLDDCAHRGPRLLVHCDLGEIEWPESLPMCERLASTLGTELLVLRRGAGGLMTRWRRRWESNKRRYANLTCVRLIMPWSSAAARFCTSELKIAIACRALAKRFAGSPILSVSGIRRAESAARSKAPVCAPQQRLVRKLAGTSGWDWHPILHWSHTEVFAFLRERNQPLHVAYTEYGCSRVSCAFCVLSSAADLAGFPMRRQPYCLPALGCTRSSIELLLSVPSLAGRCRATPPHARSYPRSRPGQTRCAPARGIGISNPGRPAAVEGRAGPAPDSE